MKTILWILLGGYALGVVVNIGSGRKMTDALAWPIKRFL